MTKMWFEPTIVFWANTITIFTIIAYISKNASNIFLKKIIYQNQFKLLTTRISSII